MSKEVEKKVNEAEENTIPETESEEKKEEKPVKESKIRKAGGWIKSHAVPIAAFGGALIGAVGTLILSNRGGSDDDDLSYDGDGDLEDDDLPVTDNEDSNEVE